MTQSLTIGFLLFPAPDPARLHRALRGAEPAARRRGEAAREAGRAGAVRYRAHHAGRYRPGRGAAARHPLRPRRTRRRRADGGCEVLDFLRAQAPGARYVTSVCTGALVLGAAGLLRGRRATTHWASHDFLAALGAVPVQGRVVRDGKIFTGGGVTAGIDFALTIAAEIAGPEAAQAIQLQIEYAPEPPFEAGRRRPPRPRCWPPPRPAAPGCGRSGRRWWRASRRGWPPPDASPLPVAAVQRSIGPMAFDSSSPRRPPPPRPPSMSGA